MRWKFVWNTNSGYIEKVNTVLYKYFCLYFYHYIYNYILLCLLMAGPISYILVITNPIIFCRKYGMNVYGEFFASIFSIQFFTVKILYCILNSEDQTTNRNWKTELNIQFVWIDFLPVYSKHQRSKASIIYQFHVWND